MLECLVFSRRAARLVNRRAERTTEEIKRIVAKESGSRTLKRSEAASLHERIRTVMSRDCSALRTKEGLANAVREIGEILEGLQSVALRIPDEFELYSMAQTALKIAESAAARKESVGAHYLDQEAVTV
jgi:aspartate oxidase